MRGDLPMASSWVNPVNDSKAGFTYSMMPSELLIRTASAVCSTTRDSLYNDASERLRSVMSWNLQTRPMGVPARRCGYEYRQHLRASYNQLRSKLSAAVSL